MGGCATPSHVPACRRSPRSSGAPRPQDLRPDADPARLAAAFERAGAAGVSVLVDERFGGQIDDLAAARSATSIPLLAKGFFTSEHELAELRRAGADGAFSSSATWTTAARAR